MKLELNNQQAETLLSILYHFEEKAQENEENRTINVSEMLITYYDYRRVKDMRKRLEKAMEAEP